MRSTGTVTGAGTGTGAGTDTGTGTGADTGTDAVTVTVMAAAVIGLDTGPPHGEHCRVSHNRALERRAQGGSKSWEK
jgi:hypothetical protein